MPQPLQGAIAYIVDDEERIADSPSFAHISKQIWLRLDARSVCRRGRKLGVRAHDRAYIYWALVGGAG